MQLDTFPWRIKVLMHAVIEYCTSTLTVTMTINSEGGGGSPPHHLEKDGIAFYKNTAAFFYRSGF